MNIEEAKKIPIADYLHSLGYSPVKQQFGARNMDEVFRRLAKAATSSHWHRNFTVPTICRTS
jgi:hypothetical protein